MIKSFIQPLFHDIKTQVLDLLFPIRCLACGAENPKFICANCSETLEILPAQFCIACHKMSIGGLTHPRCQTAFGADGLISIYDYHDKKIANLLIKGKYFFLPQIYEELGILIAEKIKAEFPHLLNLKSEISNLQLCPIPLHWMRQNWRGFNQANILCNKLGAELNLELNDVLVRKKFTKTQKDLKKAERVKNVEQAFGLKPGVEVRGKNFILVDDVTTTGLTLQEAAKVLKRNGAKSVWCLTVARD